MICGQARKAFFIQILLKYIFGISDILNFGILRTGIINHSSCIWSIQHMQPMKIPVDEVNIFNFTG
jgi:hypothetical protein